MRQRLTWSRIASAHPATPDEGPASPAHTQDDPNEHQYENGDTSSWAEDPTKGPYPQSAHPAYPDEGPASPAYKQARLEIKAAKCIKMAKAMLPKTASVQMIEDQALSFMDLDNRSIQASLSRLAGEEEEVVEEEEDKEEGKTAAEAEEEPEAEEEVEEVKKEARLLKAQVKFLQTKLARLTRTAGEEEVVEEKEEEVKKEAAKKASRIARLRRLAGEEEVVEEKEVKKEANWSLSSEALLEEMLAEEGMSDCESCGEEGMDEEALLEEMLAEEGMMPVAPATAENEIESNLPAPAPEEAACEPEAEAFFEEEFPVLEEEEVFFGEEEDPMGFLDNDMDADERLLMAKLFGKSAGDEAEEEPKEEEKPKTASTQTRTASVVQKPQPKKPNPGVTRLGGVQKEANSNNDLSKLWETAPDISKFF